MTLDKPLTERTRDCPPVDWIVDHPKTQSVFESLGIDCSCGGKSLEYLCRGRGLDPDEVMRRLLNVIELSSKPSSP